MTALTGETGAGKTLLVEALELVLGGRARPGLVRAGADRGARRGRFVLRTRGRHEEVEVVLARAVPATGRSRAWVDGRMAPVAALAEAAAGLVDIHGQHAAPVAARPRPPSAAPSTLFAGSTSAPSRRPARLLACIASARRHSGGDDRPRAREADVLRHQLAEIDAAASR